jgi:hypothetical protein
MSEVKALKTALANAVETALSNYLIEHAGEDLPVDQLELGNYRFEVSRLTNLEVSVRAKQMDARDRSMDRPAHFFTIKVSGS